MNICETCNNHFTTKYVDTKRPRRFCSLSCAGKRPNYKRRIRISKQCLQCNTNFESTPHTLQKFCSKTCSTSHSNRRRKVNNCCKLCNKNTYTGKYFCSRICMGKYKSFQTINMFNDGKLLISSQAIRKYLIERANNVCELCFWGKLHPDTKRSVLQIHHKDGNADNNHPSNLQVLCPNCHSLTSTFGARNKGNGRKYRYKQINDGSRRQDGSLL